MCVCVRVRVCVCARVCVCVCVCLWDNNNLELPWPAQHKQYCGVTIVNPKPLNPKPPVLGHWPCRSGAPSSFEPGFGFRGLGFCGLGVLGFRV